MASSLPDASSCCPVTCDNEVAVAVPGPAGDDGTNGTNGANGVSAFTTTGAGFNMPAEGADTASLLVGSSAWMGVGQKVWVTNAGTMQVVSKADITHVVLRNIESTASGTYADNVAPGTAVGIGQTVSPAGMQGPVGAAAAGAFLIANNLSEGVAATMRGNLGLGALAVLAAVNDGNWSGTDLAVTNGGTGSSTAAGARTNLGAQAQDDILDDIAGLTQAANKSIYFDSATTAATYDLTAAGRAILDDADAAAQRVTLGISRVVNDVLIYQHQLGAGTDAGTFNNGTWRTVPLNTEVADTGNYGSIASNTITLATGTYRVRWHMTAYNVDRFQSRLYNVTNLAIIGYGSTSKAAASSSAESSGEARITITAATEDIRIEAQCETSEITDGFGIANAFGGTQCYAGIVLEKESA